jgi:hypothetical protein
MKRYIISTLLFLTVLGLPTASILAIKTINVVRNVKEINFDKEATSTFGAEQKKIDQNIYWDYKLKDLIIYATDETDF